MTIAPSCLPVPPKPKGVQAFGMCLGKLCCFIVSRFLPSTGSTATFAQLISPQKQVPKLDVLQIPIDQCLALVDSCYLVTCLFPIRTMPPML